MRDVISLKVLVFIDGIEQDPNKFSPKEVVMIAQEIKRLWPDDLYYRIWFDVEFIKPKRDWWEVLFRVVCYRMPGKDEHHPIPEELLNKFVNKKIKIYPFDDYKHQIVEVVHVIE